jgi:hypothetical protein
LADRRWRWPNREVWRMRLDRRSLAGDCGAAAESATKRNFSSAIPVVLLYDLSIDRYRSRASGRDVSCGGTPPAAGLAELDLLPAHRFSRADIQPGRRKECPSRRACHHRHVDLQRRHYLGFGSPGAGRRHPLKVIGRRKAIFPWRGAFFTFPSGSCLMHIAC